MGDIELSRGVIATAMRSDEEFPPGSSIQVLGFKKIASQGGQDRYRLHISDGEHSHSFAMLATQLNHLIHDGTLENFAVIKVEKMVCNTMNNKKIMIILNLEVEVPGRDVGHKLGNPVAWNENAAAAAAAAGGGGGGDSNANSGNFPRSTNRTSPSSNGVPSGSFYGSSNANNSNANNSVNGSVNVYNTSGQNKGSGGAFGGNKTGGQSKPHYASSDINDASVVPIRDINPYASKVTIRARVTNKGPVKTWSNSRGEGKLFSMDLLDDTGEIRMTAFKESVDQFYDMIEPNNVYYISKFAVKSANKQFTSIPHDYELSFTPETQVIPYLKDTSDIPSLTFNFVDIGEIENIQPDTTIDVIGVCKGYTDVQTITVRSSGKELKKRELTLVDKTCKEINLTLWGKTAEDFNDDSQPIVAVKGAKVGDFGGRTLSCQFASVLQINPDLPEAHSLRGWYDNEGSTMASQSLSGLGRGAGGGAGGTPWKTCSEAIEVNTQDMEKPDYFMAKVTLMAIRRENALYQACPTDKCNKKVVDQGNGMFRCEKCNQDHTSFKWRIILHGNFADFTDNFWASAFQETGEVILGKKADEVGHMYANQPDEFDQVIKDASFQTYIGKFRSKMDNYNNETRKKVDVMELTKINHAEYCKQLLAEIQETQS